MSENLNSQEQQRVAIIGAGPSGLCALKHLIHSSDKFEPVAFEKNSLPGGQWNYSDQNSYDDFGQPVHSAIYDDMFTNLPKELMQIPGFPFPKDLTKSYIHRSKVTEYLNNFIDHYGIRKYIKVHTLVKHVSPIDKTETGGFVKWSVDTVDVRKPQEVKTEVFDAVFVCNGHDSTPHIPDIPGKDTFKGRVLHSKNYRKAVQFEGQTVAVLGCNLSGQDISMQISQCAKKVYACHKLDPKIFPETFPKDIVQKEPFVRMTENTIVFADGSEIEVNAVIFCTGYKYSFPFLKKGLVEIKNKRVTPVYKHMIHAKYSNMILFGLPSDVPYFAHFHEMGRLAVLILEGKVSLPSLEEMVRESDCEFERKQAEGLPPLFAHYFTHGVQQTQFNAELSKLGGFPPLPRFYQYLWDDMLEERRTNIVNCTTFDYVITGENTYRCLQPEKVKSTLSKAENLL